MSTTRFAAAATALLIPLFAPIYLQSLWPEARTTVGDSWVAIVREPFFAKIAFFTWYPAYWALLWAVAAATALLWGAVLMSWWKRRRQPADGPTPIPLRAAAPAAPAVGTPLPKAA